MSRYAKVVVESDLIQLDREFDFITPEAMASRVRFGQRVRFPIGRAKKLYSGFIVELMEESAFATSELVDFVDEQPLLDQERYQLAKQIAHRQCVAVGEILSQMIPDHMPKIELVQPTAAEIPEVLFPTLPGVEKLSDRAAVLTSSRYLNLAVGRIPDWCILFAREAYTNLRASRSSILILPEQDQLQQLLRALEAFGLSDFVLDYSTSSKKSDRFRKFHQALNSDLSIVVGTRSAVYAPAKNVGAIMLFDDGDDSLREQGSPFTHAREVAMIRAGNQTRLLLAANYRSLEVQRLVEINYLRDFTINLPPHRISFSEGFTRLDSAAFKLIRESVDNGPVLVLLPRKGESASIYCGGCGSRLKCQKCSGPIWEPEPGKHRCRICKSLSQGCSQCGSNQTRRGRTGSARTVAEFGKAFPQVAISEATADKKPGKIRSRNHIVIATPGSAPITQHGYAAVVILDSDVWLSRPIIRAEQNAIRDWMEAIDLLSENGRALVVGLDATLGAALALGQHRQLAKKSLADLTALKLPPTVRITSLESDPQTIATALDLLTGSGAEVLRSELSPNATALIRFGYSQGQEMSTQIKGLALKTNARLVGANKRRGLRVVMDDPIAL